MPRLIVASGQCSLTAKISCFSVGGGVPDFHSATRLMYHSDMIASDGGWRDELLSAVAVGSCRLWTAAPTGGHNARISDRRKRMSVHTFPSVRSFTALVARRKYLTDQASTGRASRVPCTPEQRRVPELRRSFSCDSASSMEISSFGGSACSSSVSTGEIIPAPSSRAPSASASSTAARSISSRDRKQIHTKV